MQRLVKVFIVLIIVSVFAAVFFYFKAAGAKNVRLGYYYWNSKFELDTQKKALLSLSEAPLYLHVFDVDAPDGIRLIPIAELTDFSMKDKRQIIPVIYLTQKGLNALRYTDIDTLSKHMIQKAERVTKLERQNWYALQIDCDWTETNQKKYFALLKSLKKELGGQSLSATIRLHQIKFREKTGVPPVDRGMLMFYNAGNIEFLNADNSIYSTANVKPYIDRIETYPLQLDYALPAFSWGLLYRLGRIEKILSTNQLASVLKSGHVSKVSAQVYSITKSGFWEGAYFFKGDQIKIEEIGAKTCLDAALQLAPHVKNNNFTICLFQLGSPTLSKYNDTEINKIRAAFN